MVNRDVPSNSVVVGNPARVISKLDDYIRKNKINMESGPVWDSYWKNKSTAECLEMRERLINGGWGYDD